MDDKYIRQSVTQLKKLFLQKYDADAEISPTKGYLDVTGVIMLIPKTQQLKDYILKNFEVTERDIVSLDYSSNSGTGKYSVDFISLILGMLKNTNFKTLEISAGSDYPLSLETKEIKIIIAPRVEQ